MIQMMPNFWLTIFMMMIFLMMTNLMNLNLSVKKKIKLMLK